MPSRGTQEDKRAARAAPSPQESHPWVAFIALPLLVALFVWLFRFTDVHLFAFGAVVGLGALVGLVLWFAYRIGLLMAVRLKWRPSGVRCLLVHSRSPVWEGHVESVWLPRIGHIARNLDWSERAVWRPTLEVRVFRHFLQEWRNFNPAVVVFRDLSAPLVFRFYYAFHEAKGGRPEYLQSLEAELFKVLGA